MHTSRRRAAVPVAVALVLVLAACAPAAPRTSADGRLRIATTVAPITSIVAAIAGEHAEITGLVPEGLNSHTFEPPPSAAELLSTVDLVIMNGLGLELPTARLATANMADGAELVLLGDRVLQPEEYIYDFSFPREEGSPNPHLWTDPGLVKAYAEVVTDVLSNRDPANAPGYRDNLGAYLAAVDRLDGAMRSAFDTIPPGNRKLLTYHDSFAYFARSYDGWEVVGAVQVPNFTDPPPRRVAELITQIREEGVPAIFGSEVFPSAVLEQIAAETGAAYVAELRDDDLPGEPGDPEHSLLGLLRFDYATITAALGGDASSLVDHVIRGVAPDRATYPQ